ncbi:MAG: phosphate acetyltransferase [Desulfobulbus propionicus]|nr:MAG: phosphate acetyltransferase [Desulfobulbus propionicus]
MTKNLYITATEEQSGKSAIILGTMQLLKKSLDRVAFYRPIIDDQPFGRHDYDIDLVLKYFKLDTPYEDTYAYTLGQARQLITSGEQGVLFETILKKYKHLEQHHDFVLCEGTNFRGKDANFEFDLNSDIASNLGSPVLIVASGRNKTADEICSFTQITMDVLTEKGVDLAACIINRAPEGFLKDSEGSLTCQAQFNSAVPLYTIPENKALSNPSVGDVRRWLGGRVLYGEAHLRTLVDNYIVAAMQIDNFLEYIKPASLIITPGDRADIILASLASRISESYPNISAILLTGGLEPRANVHKLIQGWTGTPVPIISVDTHTYQTVQCISDLYGRLEADDQQRIATALGEFDRHVNVAELQEKVVSQRTRRITPKMFEYALVERAARNRQRIVLPEGTGDRVLTATDIALRRGFADIILLGKEEQIRARASTLNIDIDGAAIINPVTSPYYDDFVETYYQLRKHKNIVREVARDRMSDPTYFGTMMVHKDLADGMVSGSVTTTAQTIRPAFEFIKTKPGVSIVSSVFIMCLQSRILVYGDCAVNPNPNARQLAEIALSAAETAQIYGIEPRVALLSYSTGESGKGADVEKVVEATKIALELMEERGLQYPLEGPLQYDAAVDPEVARLKLPDSKVAGKATVFIFPDLNTGNNTYKAVQRAAKAVAMGPILQGLNKPVNDLSRGCTVHDIVDTIALTAVQAQAAKGI